MSRAPTPASRALQALDIDSAIERIANGTLTKTIAAEYGVPKPTLRDRLVKHPRYPEAIREQAESIVEKATEEMMDDALVADNAVIARARARVDTAFKWAAARDPERWGAKQEVTVKLPMLALRFGIAAPQEKDVTPESDSQPID